MLKLFAVCVLLCQFFDGRTTVDADEDQHTAKKRQISTEWERPGPYVPGPPPPQQTPKLAQIGRMIHHEPPNYTYETQTENSQANNQQCNESTLMNFDKILDLLKMLFNNFPVTEMMGHECFKTLSGEGPYGTAKLREWIRRLPNILPIPAMLVEYVEEPVVRVISMVKFLECILMRLTWKIMLGPLTLGTWLTYTEPYSYYGFLCEDSQYLAGMAMEKTQMIDNLLM